MPDIHASMLALHVPNVLPKYVPWIDFARHKGIYIDHHSQWVRHAGRGIWWLLLFLIGLGIGNHLAKKPKSPEPATWAQNILGAMGVWAMMALGYGTIPHEWLTFSNSYLNFNTATFMMKRNRFIHFDITRSIAGDVGVTVIYGIVLTLQIIMFSKWQKRAVAEAVPDDETAPSEPTRGNPLARLLRRREARLGIRSTCDNERQLMARTDANPPMPEFSTSYVLQEVDPKWLTQAVKPKQFLHIDQAECILCEGCVDICPWKCIHMLSNDAIDEAVNADQPGDDPRDHVFFVVDEDVCTRCALCVDRCPTGVIILGKVTDEWQAGDPNERTNRHGYAYGVRF